MSKPRYSLLPTISVNRPVTVLMGLLMILVLGVIAYTRIPIELMPAEMIAKEKELRASNTYYEAVGAATLPTSIRSIGLNWKLRNEANPAYTRYCK